MVRNQKCPHVENIIVFIKLQKTLTYAETSVWLTSYHFDELFTTGCPGSCIHYLQSGVITLQKIHPKSICQTQISHNIPRTWHLFRLFNHFQSVYRAPPSVRSFKLIRQTRTSHWALYFAILWLNSFRAQFIWVEINYIWIFFHF